eukprot:2891894-Pyramimonas_sp.AAC.1
MLNGRENCPSIATRALRRQSQLANRGSSWGRTPADCSFAHKMSESTRSKAQKHQSSIAKYGRARSQQRTYNKTASPAPCSLR